MLYYTESEFIRSKQFSVTSLKIRSKHVSLGSRVAIKEPLLRIKQKQQRLILAREHKDCSWNRRVQV